MDEKRQLYDILRLRQPEMVLGFWQAARALAQDITEDEARLL